MEPAMSSDPGITLVIKSGSIQAATEYAAQRGIYAQSMELHPKFAEVRARVRKAYLDAVCAWFNEPIETLPAGMKMFGSLLFYSVDDTQETLGWSKVQS
jgi:hypothetical protein